MSGMTVRVSPKMTAFVERQIASGDYASAADVVADALSLLELERQKVDALRRELDIGIRQFERGEYSELDIDEIARSVLSRETA